MQSHDIRRCPDGSIDFEFYRREAHRARSEARKLSVKDAFAVLKQVSHVLSMRDAKSGLNAGAERA